MISLDQISLVYEDHGREVHACREVSLEVKPGEFLGILGPSGSGKSSLLYLMSGLKVPTSGSVRWRGDDLAGMGDEVRAEIRLKEFGFVFQYPYLIGYLTALENVLVALPSEDRVAEAERLLVSLGLADHMRRYPHQLSGGQKQRVCVARALLGSPAAVFADEPTAALDHTSGRGVMGLLNEHRGAGALVVVTHDPVMLEGADRVIEMEDGAIVS
ncbi:ABC transporter ATP-binding protein [bacterium]|nr:ABC transporter ATP-binding protein [bacterium]